MLTTITSTCCCSPLQDRGHSPWQRGLLLNHSETGVTATHYSFGSSTDLKPKLHTLREDHVMDLTGRNCRAAFGEEPGRWAAVEAAAHSPAVGVWAGLGGLGAQHITFH